MGGAILWPEVASLIEIAKGIKVLRIRSRVRTNLRRFCEMRGLTLCFERVPQSCQQSQLPNRCVWSTFPSWAWSRSGWGYFYLLFSYRSEFERLAVQCISALWITNQLVHRFGTVYTVGTIFSLRLNKASLFQGCFSVRHGSFQTV